MRGIMKIAVITDIHFGVRASSPYFIERYRLFFENIFFPMLEKENIKTVLCLGDTWEDRKQLNISAIKASQEMFFNPLKDKNIQMYSILGNHDVFYRNSNETNAMDIFGLAYPNIQVISEFDVITLGGVKFGMCSWVHNENLERQLENIKNSDYDILCGHFEIQGFEMTKGNYNEHGFEQETFKTKIPVWSGHFHIKSKQGNIHYLGNPFQTNWGDVGMERGFHIFDTDSRELTFVNNPYDNYIIVPYSDDMDIEPLKGKNVRVIKGNATIDTVKFSKNISSIELVANSVAVFESNNSSVSVESKDVESEISEIKSTKELIDDYIKSVTDIDDNKRQSVHTSIFDLYDRAMTMTDNSETE